MWWNTPSPKEVKENEKNEQVSVNSLYKKAKKINSNTSQKDVTELLKEISMHLNNYDTPEIHELHRLVSNCYSSIVGSKLKEDPFKHLKLFLN